MAYRTDLACEAMELSARGGKADVKQAGVESETSIIHGFSVQTVRVTSEAGEHAIGKKQGQYTTVDLGALLRREEDAFSRACKAVAQVLSSLLPPEMLAPVLVIGLGNRAITADAIGPCAVESVLATRHLVSKAPDHFASWRPVAALSPGVLGQTGLEVGEVVCGLIDTMKPAAVIAIDALAAGRLSRLTRTVQLTDTGIVPGSGVGNARFALTQETLGIPVIAVGVPTVVDGATLAHELREQLSGSSCEALLDLETPVVVTTRDIDTEVAGAARVVGYAIDLALHPMLDIADVDLFLS